MKNRAIKKLLSVVLVMAICVSTVLGCLITVNAADTGATYTVTAESLHAYADEGKATMTFDLASGFTSGSFTLLKDNASFSVNYDKEGNLILPAPWNSEYGDVEIEVVGGTIINSDGTTSVLTADQMSVSIFNDTNNNGTNDAEEDGDVKSLNNALWYDADGNYKDAEGNNYAFVPDVTENRFETFRLSNISFNSGDVVYKSLTLEFTFEWDYCMQPNSKNEIIFAQEGQKDHLGNEYAAPVLKNGETSYVLSENVVEGNINYFHSHCAKNIDTNAQLLQKNDYGIYSSVCDLCGKAGVQLFPDDISGTKANAYYDISAMNIVYEDDGTVSLNVHCPGFNGTKEKLVISYTDGKKTIYGDNKTSEMVGNTSMELSPYAKEKVIKDDGTFYYLDNVLPADTYMYVIKGLSAKDIDTKFYLTRIVEGSGELYEGKLFAGNTQEVSLADYCSGVVGGTKVYYPEGTTDAQIAADKAVAAAFIKYGVEAANALNHKVVTEEKEIVVTDTWDGTKVEPTETDYAGNIIINTAEELAWVAMDTTPATTGKSYKVAPNSVFDMKGFDGITIASTAAQVKTATKLGNNWGNNSAVFYGNFDGNGLIVYNISGTPGLQYGGLFAAVKNVNSTIKNVTVKASAFYGYHYSAGIIGMADGSTYTVNISNCAVENCYISDNKATEGAWDLARTAGTIIGGSANAGIVMKNCCAVNNLLDAQEIENGFIGKSSNWGNGITISDCISIGTSPHPVIVGTESKDPVDLGGNISKEPYTNVYTDIDCSAQGVTVLSKENMKGSAAKDNMSGLDWNGVWATTDSYPTFNPDILRTDTWDGTKVEPTATDANGNIIINTAEEMAWVALAGGAATEGKSYKVADGMKYFNMNGSVGIAINSTVLEVKASTATANLWDRSEDFLGTFDGNGVTIYNIRNSVGVAYGGLFPRIHGVNSSIKNVTVKASVFYAFHGAGAILGQGSGQFTTTIENCAVENCYMTDNNDTNSDAQRSAGIFVGSSANHCIKINNCFAKGNECSGVHSYGGFVGRASAWAPGNFTFTNTISLGVSPYTTAGAGAIGDDIAVKATWTNVYTDTDLPSGASTNAVNGIIKLTTAQMIGNAAVENMPGLAWGAEWFEGKAGEYPSIFGEVYADTWDGTKVEPTETDSEGNIIVRTAEQLAWVALSSEHTEEKNYKVADGIKYFDMNGKVGITLDSTVDEVKSAATTSTPWLNGETTANFKGTFDGNGVTIYNVYAKGGGYSGLFPTIIDAPSNGVRPTATIKNINLCASYFVAYHNVGGIVGQAKGYPTTLAVEKCSVTSCYFGDNYPSDSVSPSIGAIVGSANHNKTTLSDCFAADNIQENTETNGGFIGECTDNATITVRDSIIIGMLPYPTTVTATPGAKVTTSATYTNIYTDQVFDTAIYAGITKIDTADAKGAGADEAMPNLAWGTDWFTGKPGEYPCFVDDGIEYAPDEIEALLVANGYYSQFIANFANNYNRDSFTTSDENCNFYATGLTLKTNPYMTVTFAFLYDYRENKDEIEAVFTVGDQSITVKGNEMVNNAGAGRYHMVRLKDIKVKNLCEEINVTLNYNGAQVGSGHFSVAGFGFTAADAGEGYEYYESAAQALVFYAEALQRRAALR